jgi:hypothetical protein
MHPASLLRREAPKCASRGVSCVRQWMAVLLAMVACQGALSPRSGAVAQTIDGSVSSERIKADPAGQYILIKTIAASLIPAANHSAPRADPDGYEIAGCWTPRHLLADWTARADLAGRMIALALRTAAWTRDLVRGGYPAAGLAEAIGRYEAAVVAAGATEAALDRGLAAFAAELETLRRTTPGAMKTNMGGGCARPDFAVQLRYKTVPADGRAQFIPKTLHELCRAQGLDPNDARRCDYWMESPENEPRYFVGDYVWQARWPDGTTALGEFDARSIAEPGVVTLRQKK